MRTSGQFDPVIARPPALVAPVRLDPTGRNGPTPGAAAGPRWRRSSHGCYVPTRVDGELPEQRVVEQAARLPPGGVVSGWAACRLHGAAFFDGRGRGGEHLPVLLAIGPDAHVRGGNGAVVSREPLRDEDRTARHGVRCATIRRAVFDELRRPGDWRERVVSVDMVAAAGLVSIAQLKAFHADRSGWRRARHVPRALAHASERSRSPGETRLRLVWELDAGLPRPLVNQEVFTPAGRLLGVADLFDPVAGLVGEYDGADHLRVRRRSRDLDREEAFRRAGLGYVAVVGPDLGEPDRLVARLRSAYSRALVENEPRRRWTTQPPPGWPRDESLDERLWLREIADTAPAAGPVNPAH